MEMLSGAEFLSRITQEYELSVTELALAEAAAREIDAAIATTSARDKRSTDRLVGELAARLLDRLDAADGGPTPSSVSGRKLARARWDK